MNISFTAPKWLITAACILIGQRICFTKESDIRKILGNIAKTSM